MGDYPICVNHHDHCGIDGEPVADDRNCKSLSCVGSITAVYGQRKRFGDCDSRTHNEPDTNGCIVPCGGGEVWVKCWVTEGATWDT